MKGGEEIDRGKQKARRAMKGEREKAKTQRKASEVWHEEHGNGGADSVGQDRQ